MELTKGLRPQALATLFFVLGLLTSGLAPEIVFAQNRTHQKPQGTVSEVKAAPESLEALAETVLSKRVSQKDQLKNLRKLISAKFQIPHDMQDRFKELFKSNRMVYWEEKQFAEDLMKLFLAQGSRGLSQDTPSDSWVRFLFDFYADETAKSKAYKGGLSPYEEFFLNNFELFSDRQLFNLGDRYIVEKFNKPNIHELFLDLLEDEKDSKNLVLRSKPIGALRDLYIDRNLSDKRMRGILFDRYIKNSDKHLNSDYMVHIIPVLNREKQPNNPRDFEPYLDSTKPEIRHATIKKIVLDLHDKDSPYFADFAKILRAAHSKGLRDLKDPNKASKVNEEIFIESQKGLSNLSRKIFEDPSLFENLIDGLVLSRKDANGNFRDDDFSKGTLQAFTLSSFINRGDYLFKEQLKRLSNKRKTEVLEALVSFLKSNDEQNRKTAALAIRYLFETHLPPENLDKSLKRVFPDFDLEKLQSGSNTSGNVTVEDFLRVFFVFPLFLGESGSNNSSDSTGPTERIKEKLKKLTPAEATDLESKLKELFDRYPKAIAKPN